MKQSSPEVASKGRSGERRIVVERLKAELLGELRLMTTGDLRRHWEQVRWPKASLVALAKCESEPGKPTPLAHGLRRLEPTILDQASAQFDPFGWLLEAVDVSEWSNFCRTREEPWMARLWLATASQLRAEVRLIHRAHGWADTWAKLRRTPDGLREADDYYVAHLRHAKARRRADLLVTPRLDQRLTKARQAGDEAFLRRFRRAKQGKGRRARVALAEKFTVQHWLELPRGFPGLCFFSDFALHDLLEAFGLTKGDAYATKQLRGRVGLIQAGAKRHLIEEVIDCNNRLLFQGGLLEEPWKLTSAAITWGERQLWPSSR